jgi:hypothetical protein
VTTATSVGSGTVTLDSGTFQNAGGGALSFSNNFSLANTTVGGTLDTNTSGGGGNLTLTGQVSGTGALNIIGGGTVTLNDTALGNSYSGGTSVTDHSTVAVTTATSVGSGAVTLDNGTFQNASGGSLSVANNFSLGSGGGTIGVPNALTLTGLISDGAPGAGPLIVTGGSTPGKSELHADRRIPELDRESFGQRSQSDRAQYRGRAQQVLQ